MLGEVKCAEACCLRTEDGASPGAALAGENAGVVLACELLVHTVKIADFAAADTYVTCGDVLVGADAVPEFKHEGLAETHDFVIGLAYRVEIRAALCAAHGKGREGILEGLFEAQEFEHGRGDRLVETEAALIRTDGTVELDTITGVGLNFAVVVRPGYAEGENAVRLYDAFHDFCLFEFRVLVVNILD